MHLLVQMEYMMAGSWCEKMPHLIETLSCPLCSMARWSITTLLRTLKLHGCTAWTEGPQWTVCVGHCLSRLKEAVAWHETCT